MPSYAAPRRCGTRAPRGARRVPLSGGRGMSPATQVWFFWGLMVAVFSVMAIVAALVPDVPDDVVTQLARQRHIVDKVVKHTPDDDADSEEAREGATPAPLCAEDGLFFVVEA